MGSFLQLLRQAFIHSDQDKSCNLWWLLKCHLGQCEGETSCQIIVDSQQERMTLINFLSRPVGLVPDGWPASYVSTHSAIVWVRGMTRLCFSSFGPWKEVVNHWSGEVPEWDFVGKWMGCFMAACISQKNFSRAQTLGCSWGSCEL